MESFQIESATHKASFLLKGAELCSLIDKKTGTEFIWQANPAVWARHAPVLFPIVGKLNNDNYRFEGKEYHLPQHGFARDQQFEVVEVYTDTLRFMLTHTPELNNQYPFAFKLFITFELKENTLLTQYEVYNPGIENTYFSVGAHPGFQLPKSGLDNYIISLAGIEIPPRKLLSQGLFNHQTEVLPFNQNQINLDSNSFAKDAWVFELQNHYSLSIKDKHSPWQVSMEVENMPYLGIWTKFPCEDFVCLEPWAGLADDVDFNGPLEDKKGIQCLGPGSSLKFSFKTSFSL